MLVQVGLLAGCFEIEQGDLVLASGDCAQVFGVVEDRLVLTSVLTGQTWIEETRNAVLVAKRLGEFDEFEPNFTRQATALDRLATPCPETRDLSFPYTGNEEPTVLSEARIDSLIRILEGFTLETRDPVLTER